MHDDDARGLQLGSVPSESMHNGYYRSFPVIYKYTPSVYVTGLQRTTFAMPTAPCTCTFFKPSRCTTPFGFLLIYLSNVRRCHWHLHARGEAWCWPCHPVTPHRVAQTRLQTWPTPSPQYCQPPSMLQLLSQHGAPASWPTAVPQPWPPLQPVRRLQLPATLLAHHLASHHGFLHTDTLVVVPCRAVMVRQRWRRCPRSRLRPLVPCLPPSQC